MSTTRERNSNIHTIAVALVMHAAKEENEMIEVGKAAMDFCLASGSGEEICLRDNRGKWVVLFFYVRDNTSG